MGKAAYPHEGDGFQFLMSAGLRSSGTQTETESALQLADMMVAGRQKFEELTGRRILAVAQTRVFNPPGGYSRILKLNADLAALTSLSVDGTAKTLNTDFYLKPDNADFDGKPWRWIEFVTAFAPEFQRARSISINASWGFATTIPEAAWMAMIKLGVAESGAALAQAITGGVVSWEEADAKENYGKDPLSGFIDRCRDDAVKVASSPIYLNTAAYLS